jgi:hypothetical protein
LVFGFINIVVNRQLAQEQKRCLYLIADGLIKDSHPQTIWFNCRNAAFHQYPVALRKSPISDYQRFDR